jgi:hypothetical protein
MMIQAVQVPHGKALMLKVRLKNSNQLQKQNTEIASELSRSRRLFVGHFSKIHAKEIENAIFDSSSVPEDFEDNWSTAL